VARRCNRRSLLTCGGCGGGGGLGADRRELRQRAGVLVVQAAVAYVCVRHVLSRHRKLRRVRRQLLARLSAHVVVRLDSSSYHQSATADARKRGRSWVTASRIMFFGAKAVPLARAWCCRDAILLPHKPRYVVPRISRSRGSLSNYFSKIYLAQCSEQQAPHLRRRSAVIAADSRSCPTNCSASRAASTARCRPAAMLSRSEQCAGHLKHGTAPSSGSDT